MKNWMSKIDGGKHITEMAIPGTHDSGAYGSTIKPMTRAQDHTIKEQLEIGIRALDIRCAATWGSNPLTGKSYNVFHGPFDQGVSIQSVCTDIDNFLTQHNNEFVILMLKQEGGYIDISTAINDIVNKTLGHRIFVKGANWPQLNQVRGRVLVLSRLRSPHKDHFDTTGWPDNPKNTVLANVGTAAQCGIILQDNYKSPPLNDKKIAIRLALIAGYEAAAANNYNNLFVNYTSLVWKPWEPLWSGRTKVNPWIWSSCGYGKGVICVDAADKPIAKHIVKLNNVLRYVPHALTQDTLIGEKCVLCNTVCVKYTGWSSRWHFCKGCKSIFCDSCGKNTLKWWGVLSRERKCNNCESATELV